MGYYNLPSAVSANMIDTGTFTLPRLILIKAWHSADSTTIAYTLPAEE